jgi:hypothetical protein
MLSKDKLVSNGNNAEQCYGYFVAQCVHFGVFSKCHSQLSLRDLDVDKAVVGCLGAFNSSIP